MFMNINNYEINELASVKSVAAMAATVATAPTPLYYIFITTLIYQWVE